MPTKETSFLTKMGSVFTLLVIVGGASWYVGNEGGQQSTLIETSQVQVQELKAALKANTEANNAIVNKLRSLEEYVVSIDYRLRRVCEEVIEVSKHTTGVDSNPDICTQVGMRRGNAPIDPFNNYSTIPQNILYNKGKHGVEGKKEGG